MGDHARNEFMLFIKLIRLDPDTGMALYPPCEVAAQLSFNLNAYTEQFLLTELTLHEAKKAVAGLLKKVNETFNCPLGWMVLMTRFEHSDIDALFRPIHSEMSSECSYDPSHGQTEVEVGFLKDWVLAPFKYEPINYKESETK